MTPTIQLRHYPLPPIDPETVLRYMGDRSPSGEVRALLADCIAECADAFTPKVCFAEFPLTLTDTCADLSFAAVSSKSLTAHLAGCTRIMVFAATVGLEIDRRIRKNTRLSPARALCLQAIGTERIEALCDIFEAEIRRETAAHGAKIRTRFSPGYGDLPLSLQTGIFQVLACPQKIGLSLNESLLMSPSKSVTAIIGITEEHGK